MKLGTKILLFGGIPFLMVSAIIVVFSAFVMFASHKLIQDGELEKKLSAEAVGTITWVSQSYTGASDTLESKYDYTYIVNGVSYTKRETDGGSPSDINRKGLKVKVCYDPSNPNDSKFYLLKYNKVCGQ